MLHTPLRFTTLLLLSLALSSCAPAADTPQAELTRLCEQDRTPAHIGRLQAFEQEHHGTHVGLMAVREISLDTNRTLEYREAAAAKHQLLNNLIDYAALPELPNVLASIHKGGYDPAIGPAFDRLIASDALPETSRPLLRFYRARWQLHTARSQREFQKRLKQLESGMPADFITEPKRVANILARLPNAAQCEAQAEQAINELRLLTQTPATSREIAVDRINDNRHLIRHNPEASRAAPRVSDLADGLLFRTLHLQPGRPAPDLNITLTTGEPWSLTDHRGKAVIIMFTFRACGACKLVYPTLNAVREALPGGVEILFITTDQDRNDTLTSITDGKLKGSVHWDGDHGPLATRWAVNSFPTLYIISPRGDIIDFPIRKKEPEAVIAAFTNLLNTP